MQINIDSNFIELIQYKRTVEFALFIHPELQNLNCLKYNMSSLRLRVQNRRTKWNFPLNFRTMRKLSELYSGIFQTQSSG